jgi:hypothetical protein
MVFEPIILVLERVKMSGARDRTTTMISAEILKFQTGPITKARISVVRIQIYLGNPCFLFRCVLLCYNKEWRKDRDSNEECELSKKRANRAVEYLEF